MRLITPDFGLLFWMLVSFAIVFFVLAKWGFPIITRMVDKRRDYIDSSIEAARKANERLEGIEAESQRLLDDAERRQAEILRSAAQQSAQIIEHARITAEEQTAKQMALAKEQIEIQRRKTMGQMRAELALLSVDVAEKVLRKQLENSDKQQELIGRMIDETEQNNKHSSEA